MSCNGIENGYGVQMGEYEQLCGYCDSGKDSDDIKGWFVMAWHANGPVAVTNGGLAARIFAKKQDAVDTMEELNICGDVFPWRGRVGST